jgi:hypothetical protein
MTTAPRSAAEAADMCRAALFRLVAPDFTSCQRVWTAGTFETLRAVLSDLERERDELRAREELTP